MKHLFINGKIASLDAHANLYQAIGITDNKITFLGTTQEAKQVHADYETLIDLKGKTVIPGLNDSHMHLLNYGYTKTKLDLLPYDSIDAMIKGGQVFLSHMNLNQTSWLLARGWNQDKVEEKRYPTKADLDLISTDIPIIFTRVCGHISVCNSAAIKHVDLSAAGHLAAYIDLDTGLFQEDALNLLYGAVPSPDVPAIKEMLVDGANDLLAMGVTSVQTDDLCCMPDQDYNKILQAYKELHDENRLPIRVYQQCLFFNQESFKTFVDQGYRTGQGDAFFKIGPLKLLLDGSLGARTAYLLDPYADDATTKGIPCFEDRELNQLVDYALSNNFQLAAHGIGDGAIQMFIDSLENSPNNHYNDQRHGVVHAQITSYALIDQMAKQQLLAYVQPIFLDYDLHIVRDRVGHKAEESYAFKTMWNKGVLPCMGTDAPVVDINPYENIYSAVVRKDLQGQPKVAYLEKEAFTLEEALKAYTYNGAYSSFEEDIKGTLEIGKLADFIVLDKDIYSLPSEELKDIQCLMTVLDGKIVYEK